MMMAAAAQEAEHLAVLEPMAQSYSPEEILRALTPENCRLVALIHRHRPQSITELCRLASRPQPNVSRSLAALERAGIVSMVGSRPKRPELAVQRVTIELAELQNG
jgi:predicted transcriptional regulator